MVSSKLRAVIITAQLKKQAASAIWVSLLGKDRFESLQRALQKFEGKKLTDNEVLIILLDSFIAKNPNLEEYLSKSEKLEKILRRQ